MKQDVQEILNAVSFAQKIIFGRTNYNKEITAFPTHREFYKEQADVVIEYCNKNGIFCHIKNGTIAF